MAGIVARRARRWLPDGSFFDGVGATPVGARLAGDAILRAPSPASQAQCRGVRGLTARHKSVGARLAGDGDLTDAIAGKPGSYGDMGMA